MIKVVRILRSMEVGRNWKAGEGKKNRQKEIIQPRGDQDSDLQVSVRKKHVRNGY